MDYLRYATNYINDVLFTKQEQGEVVKMTLVDVYLNFVYRIISWEDPKLSWRSFLIINLLYMIIIFYNIRFYCFIFSSGLIVLLMDHWVDLREQPKALFGRQIEDGIKEAIERLQLLRQENPTMFCACMGSILLCLSYIGASIPGHVLFYVILLAVFFVPFLVGLLPEEFKITVNSFLNALRNTDGVVAETELIPFLKDFIEDRDPDLDSLLTDRTQDSVPNSLISGITSMPSYLDADGIDEIQEEDLLPTCRPVRSIPYSNTERSSDSDSDSRNIEFDSVHDSDSDFEIITPEEAKNT